MKEYLCWFIHEHFNFIIPEYKTLCELENVPFDCDIQDFQQGISPFLMIRLPSDEVATRIASRAILIKGIYQLWAVGKSYEELKPQLLHCQLEKEHMEVDYSFQLLVDCFGRKYTQQEKLGLMANFSFMDVLQGKVDLKNPKYTFTIIEEVGENIAKDVPFKRVFFAKEVALGARNLINKFDVKKRVYIGTTSMDSALSLVIANMAKADKGTLILDPFVGTGSLLVTCSHFGAMTMGADLDPRVLRGKGGKSVVSNYKQYEVLHRFVDLIIHDHSKSNVWHAANMFDAIVCDPPYGIRAGARKVGKKNKPKKKKPLPPAEEMIDPHIPSCIPYSVTDVLHDLTAFAAKTLVMNGRLIYWLPTTDEYKDSDLPQHPCLELYSNSEQILSWKMRRRLITLVKVNEYIPEVHDSYEFEVIGTPAHANYGMKILLDENRADNRNDPSNFVPQSQV